VRRIQVGLEADPERDSFVLEGNVRTIQDLQRAMALAERQLGGSGVNLVVADDERISFGRHQGVGIGGQGLGQLGGGLPAPGLANKLSRGLIVTSASGRVISFLEIDELAQIMVSIRVFEVDRGKARKMGINFRIDTEHVAIGNYVGPQSGALPSALGGRPNAGGFAGGFGGNVGSGVGGNLVVSFVDRATAILSAIDFLDSKSLVRAVAEPNILTLSGESASVLVGGEVPIPTATSNQSSTFQGVFFQNFGVRLDLRPTVDADGVVTLEVAPSIVRPDPSLGVGGVPGFQIQTVQTTARVAAGESLVLGGLLTFEEGEGQRGLPGLDKIPIFRWRNRTHREQELMFVITPRLMGISSDAAREAELGPLEWPEDRGQWIENLKPAEYGIDGVLPSFEASPEPAVVTPSPAPAQGSYYAPAPAPAPLPAPAPVYSTPAPAPEDTEPPPSAALDAEPYETSSPGDAFVSVESLPEAPPLSGASGTSDARH